MLLVAFSVFAVASEQESKPLTDFSEASVAEKWLSVNHNVMGGVSEGDFRITDQKTGPFLVEVGWIRADGGPADNTQSTMRASDDSEHEKTIVETAVAAGQLNTLVAAVKAAGLAEALQGGGPLTVFAPNDAAFAKLPEGTVEDLLRPQNRDKLVAVLSYHVVQGEIRMGVLFPKTLQGEPLTIKTSGSLGVNGAKVVAANIEASNGLIHIIDSVLLPPEASCWIQCAPCASSPFFIRRHSLSVVASSRRCFIEML